MRTNKRKDQPRRPEARLRAETHYSVQARSLKIQPKYRFNQCSTSIVPELKLCGNWLEKIGFEAESRVTVHASKELIVIRPEQ